MLAKYNRLNFANVSLLFVSKSFEFLNIFKKITKYFRKYRCRCSLRLVPYIVDFFCCCNCFVALGLAGKLCEQ